MKTKTLRGWMVLALVVSALALGVGPATAGERASQKDIVDTAVDAGSFKTLVAALAGGRSRRDPEGAGPVHGLCADRRGLRQAPCGHD